MKFTLTLSFIFAASAFGQADVAGRVNPFVGTDGHGHTFPGATVPYGMVQLSPDTRVEGWDACSGYHYSDSTILGFSHTHLSGTGVADYGDILFMPMTRKPDLDPHRYRSSFYHRNESAEPGYYSVLLNDDSIAVELTATERVGIHRYRFPKTNSASVLIDLRHGLGPDIVIESWMRRDGEATISGFRRSKGWANDQHLYFTAHFSLPIREISVTNNDSIRWNKDSSSGKNVKGVLTFDTGGESALIVKVGLSSVSAEGARNNLLSEAPGWDFDAMRSAARTQWNDALSVIDVRGGTDEQQRIFYTALYHTMIAPNTFSDADGRYRGMNGEIKKAAGRKHYTVFSLWDTFRALHPLMTIIDPVRTTDCINTFLAQYDESGLLPVWELCSNETFCMIGYHSVSVIADAMAKKIGGFDGKKALTAMTASAGKDHFGLIDYRRNGYIPGEKQAESVSKTLEYAYDDWCIARTAEMLGETETARRFYSRSQNFKNVFNPSEGFMQGKKNGMWSTPFSPSAVSLDFTEANAWQYSFFVPHDIEGMIGLYGGRAPFVNKVDELFTTSSQLEGRKQADITGLIGQYAHGNEPSHHMAYLYTYAGAPSKTQERVQQILSTMYSSAPDGLAGNEDCGQMSAWYVMSAMGFYQVTPGSPEYVMTTPLFDTVTIRQQNGNRFVITAERRSASDGYIQSARLNGKRMERLFFTHDDILNGSNLAVTLGSRPNDRFALPRPQNQRDSIPFTAVPYFSAEGFSFRDTLLVSISAAEPGTEIHFTTDGSLPSRSAPLYKKPITIKKSATIRAVALRNSVPSAIAEARFIKHEFAGTISLATRYSDQYTGGGNDALIDGLTGSEDFRIGHWQGYEEVDVIATIDLGNVKPIASIRTRFLQDINAWIFFPLSVSYDISDDGINFKQIFSGTTGISPETEGAVIHTIAHQSDLTARYVRVTGKNIGRCPPLHKGNGGKAWLFVDEILIE